MIFKSQISSIAFLLVIFWSNNSNTNTYPAANTNPTAADNTNNFLEDVLTV